MSNSAENQIISELKRTETNYHIFKATLIVICTAITAMVVVAEVGRAIHTQEVESKRSRDYTYCLVQSFVTAHSATDVQTNLNKCNAIPR